MANLIKSEGRTIYGIEEWIADSVEELKNDRLSLSAPGSTCTVITQNEIKEGEPLTVTISKYMLTSYKIWVKISESTAEAIIANN